MAKCKIYLGGKMSGLTFEEMNTWREQAKRLFNLKTDNQVHCINPVEYYNFEMDKSLYTEREVKEFDLHCVKNSDIILANLDYPNSIGTAIELHMAHDVWNIPVVAFGTTTNHPWIELSVTKKCKDLMEAVNYIIEFYLPNI